MESREVLLAENFYIAKNSIVDYRILVHLERELQTTFWLDNGNGLLVSSLWVVRILLGRLLYERTTLGHTIKQYTKFQHREIMRCMVKLNNLEDLAKPPLDGVLKASSSALRKHEGMEMDADAGRQEGALSNAQFSPDDDNVGSE